MDNSSIPFDGQLLQAYLSTWTREKNGSGMPWYGEKLGKRWNCFVAAKISSNLKEAQSLKTCQSPLRQLVHCKFRLN